jgi:hypothetical protein
MRLDGLRQILLVEHRFGLGEQRAKIFIGQHNRPTHRPQHAKWITQPRQG